MTAPEPDLQAIEKRCEAATDGPWEADVSDVDDCVIDDPSGCVVVIVAGDHRAPEEHVANADFITHSRQDIPALLSHIKAQESEIERLTEDNSQLRCLKRILENRFRYEMSRAEAAEAELERVRGHYDEAAQEGFRKAAELGFERAFSFLYGICRRIEPTPEAVEWGKREAEKIVAEDQSQ